MPILDHVKIAQKLRELGFEPVEGSFLGEGEANIGANVGDGTGLVYRDKTGVTLNFRTIKEDPANPGMIITVDGDTILLGTPAGTGNVVGTPPSVADGVATYDGESGLLIDGPDTKILTVLETLGEGSPTQRPVQYLRMRTTQGDDWADVIRYGQSSIGLNDNQIRIGGLVEFPSGFERPNKLLLVASSDPTVKILGSSSTKMIHENMQSSWEITKEGAISQLTGADTAILTLFNRNNTTFTSVKFKAGNILPEGNINGANGDRYYYRDASTPANSTEYIFRGATPGLTGWEELGGGGGVTDHGALTGLGDDDHAQYALLAGRTGGQELVGGDGGTDSLELKATSGTGASGSNVDLLVGNDGATLALRATYDGKIGIGTTTPLFRLALENDAGIFAKGTFGSGASILGTAYEGAGTRLLWYPKRAAFRAGQVAASEWNDTSIGDSSAAFGQNNMASGAGSAAFGVGTTSSGVYSVAMGLNSTASGSRSVAMGNATTASNSYAVAMGNGCTASGSRAVAMGNGCTATGDHSVAMGNGCDATGLASSAFGGGIISSGDYVFGIALDNLPTTNCAQDNSMCIMGGKVGIESVAPDTELHVVGNIKQVDGQEGEGKRFTSDANGVGSWEAGVAVVESRATGKTLTDDDEEIFATDDNITFTIPVTGIPDGKKYKVMNCNGVTHNSGGIGSITLDISGSTVNFNGGSELGNSVTLDGDGAWAELTWDEDFSTDGTWWIKGRDLFKTGNTGPS